jgi:hypothetical protein
VTGSREELWGAPGDIRELWVSATGLGVCGWLQGLLVASGGRSWPWGRMWPRGSKVAFSLTWGAAGAGEVAGDLGGSGVVSGGSLVALSCRWWSRGYG